MQGMTRNRIWPAKSALIFVAATAMLSGCAGQGDVSIQNESPDDVTVSTADDEFSISGYGAIVLLESGCIKNDVTVEFVSGRTTLVPGPVCPDKQIMIGSDKVDLQPADPEPSDR